MKQSKVCPACGAQVSPRTLEGFCPACTAKLTFDPSADPPLRPPDGTTMKLGDYELLEEIGRGGMGVVYKARQRSLDRTIALKMILAGRFASEAEVQRFRAEAIAAATLAHPNIVAVHEVGELEGQHFFSMDYVDGLNLAQLAGDAPLPARQAARYVRLIAQAVQYAHDHHLIHRDLKPSNVLISRDDQPKLTDFGLAKRLTGDSDLTLSGQVLGSPNFSAPEQAAGHSKAAGPAGDVYSLGAILYYLVTGRPPFLAESLERTLHHVINTDPAAPGMINPAIPGDLETICLKCLEKEPGRRYRTAQEVAEDLRRFEADEPVHARAVGATERLWRWARRNPRIASLTVSLVAVIVSGLAGVIWQWQRAERHARIETQQRVRLEQILAHKEIEKAEELFADGDVSSALARLARVLRQDSMNHIAATRLLAALTYRNFALPVTAPLTHEAAVWSAQFGPDGQRVVTGADDGSVRVWNAQTGKLLADLSRHGAVVRHTEFSPDGQRIVTASADSTARVWDAHTGQPVTPPLQHASQVRRVHFSPDGSRVVTASGDATARVWDSRTGQPVTPPLPHALYVNEAAFSPDGNWVVTASDDDTACVWDARTGERLAGPLQHRDDVWSARFSPEGKRVVTASSDRTARVWDAVTEQPLAVALPHKELVMFASFSPDGTRVVTASWDDTARIWNAATGELVAPLLEFDSDVLYAEFSPDGRRVFTIADAAARVWDAEAGTPLTELMAHEAPLRHIGGFSPDGGRVVTASFDKAAIVWDVRGGAALPEVFDGQHASRAVTCSPDGRWIAAARGREFVAHVWDASQGEIVAGPLPHGGLIATTQLSPDGRRLLTASHDGNARIWDVRSGELTTPPLPHRKAVNSAQFSRDGRRVVTASDDETARIWDTESGRELTTPLRHGAYVHWAEFSPDDRKVVTASSETGDRTAQVWDAATGQPLAARLRHALGVQSARFSPDGRRILTASEDGTARLWDAATGQPLGRPLLHRGHVRWAEFSPDGRWVVTASLDKTARVWDAVTGEPLTEPLKHAAAMRAAHFSADSRRVVTVGIEDPVIRIRDAATGLMLFEPFQHEAKVEAVLFLPDGKRLATVGGDRRLRLWETFVPPLPVPDWLPELAEAVAAKRLDAQGRSIPVNATRVVELRQQLKPGNTTNFYAHWARWFFADRDARAISPFSRITMPEHSRRQAVEPNQNSVR